jgi:NAD(P)-dependent dehydrogenase (short-subunit alcohol dehydrogenase family)
LLLTSGQHIAPMARKVAYAVSKGTLHQATATLADELAERGITVNTVNPGPTDTASLAGSDPGPRCRSAAGGTGRRGSARRLVVQQRRGLGDGSGDQFGGRLPPLGLSTGH